MGFTHDFTQWIGEDKTIGFHAKDKGGDDVNITGTVYFWVMTNPGDASALLELTSPSSGIVIDYAAGGLFTVSVSRANAATLGAGTFHWGIWEQDAGGSRVPWGTGKYIVKASVEDFV